MPSARAPDGSGQFGIPQSSLTEIWYSATTGNDGFIGAAPAAPIRSITRLGRLFWGFGLSGSAILYVDAALTDSESQQFYQFTANDSRQWTVVNGAMPVTPRFYYDARNINGSNNVGLVDGQTLAATAWVNLGNVAATPLNTQAGNPLFKKVASPGLLRGAPSVVFGGSEYMQTGAVGGLTQPVTWIVIGRFSSLAGAGVLVDGKTQRDQLYQLTGGWELYGGAGTGIPTGGDNPDPPVLNKYNFICASFIPHAATFFANGKIADTSAGLDAGVCTMVDGVTLGAGADATSKLIGEIVAAIGLDTGANSHDPTSWYQWAQYNFGLTWPQ